MDTAGRAQSPDPDRVTWAVRDTTLVALEALGASVAVSPRSKLGITWLLVSFNARGSTLQDSTRLWLLCSS